MSPGRLFIDLEEDGISRIDSGIATVDESAAGPITGDFGAAEPSERSYLGTSVSARRIVLFFSSLFLMLIGLCARAGYLGLIRGDEYRSKAEGNRLRIAAIPAERGIIYDRDGRLLVRNIPDFTLTLTPADLPREADKRAELLVRLAEIVDSTPVDLEKTLKRYPERLASPVPIKEHLEYDQAIQLDVLSGDMPGVSLGLGTKREYRLEGEKGQPILSLSHLLGYQGRINESEYAELKQKGYLPTDLIGKTGVESTYESRLRGTYGRKQIEVDAFGREQNVLAQDDPVQGEDLTLSVDLDLQETAERALKASAALNGRKKGAAIAMDPKTGEILAMVSLPAYDNNIFARGIKVDEYRDLAENPDQPLYPRAVSGLYPPGSTVKTVVAAAALTERLVSTDTTVLSTGGIRYGAWFFPDWKPGGHGVTNVIKAIAESVNTYFYAVGGGWEHVPGLGVARMGEYFRLFGLGDRLGVDLPNEGRGFIPDEEWKERAKKEPWYIGDTYHLSIGQGDILTTPLQVVTWTSVFANGGDLVRPHVVKKIASDRRTEDVSLQTLREQVVPEETVDVIRRAMRETVLSGSARALNLSPWAMAGKTGTAEWRDGQPPHAWFTGFAPYKDPKIAVVVLVEAGVEGSRAASPVGREIMETYLRKLDPTGKLAERPLPRPESATTTPAAPAPAPDAPQPPGF